MLNEFQIHKFKYYYINLYNRQNNYKSSAIYITFLLPNMISHVFNTQQCSSKNKF